uniref:Uncharacterized protein n=1 Tax=Aegilops tauschii subsp. strangulata TaxID=200361 RepID=A0A453IY10_AEGTS
AKEVQFTRNAHAIYTLISLPFTVPHTHFISPPFHIHTSPFLCLAFPSVAGVDGTARRFLWRLTDLHGDLIVAADVSLFDLQKEFSGVSRLYMAI